MAIPKLLFALAFSAALAGCGASGQEKGRDRPPPLVKVEPASTMRFVDRIEAVGTAVANEQVTLSSPVTERITRLNFDDGSFVRPLLSELTAPVNQTIQQPTVIRT